VEPPALPGGPGRPRQHARPKNTYVREDQILPHLAALAILHADHGAPDRARQANITTSAHTADLIDQLRAAGAVLTYDPDTRTIRVGDDTAIAITAARCRRKTPPSEDDRKGTRRN
jgi:hypothetical protein